MNPFPRSAPENHVALGSARTSKERKVARDGSTRGGRWLSVFIGLLVGVGLICWLTLPNRVDEPVEAPWSVNDEAFADGFGTLVGADFLRGNRIQSLLNGDEIFPAMLADIARAQRSITLETYIWESGEVSDRFIAALTERAGAGVKVHIVIDGMGALKFKDEDWARLAGAGAEIVKYGREHWYDVKPNANHRTHRKLMVVDGRVGYIGGICIADTWLGDGRRPDHWRDTHVRVEGPVARQLQSAFMANWTQTTGRLLLGETYFPAFTGEDGGGEDGRALCFASGPDEGSEAARLAYLLAIASARKSVRIAHAYFIPDDLMTQTLLRARERGVEIEVIAPAVNDSAIGRAAARSRWGALLEAGVKMHLFEPALYHCKVMIVDDTFVTVGSINFDNRSFSINDEANLCSLDPALAQAQLAAFEADRADSRPYPVEEFRARPVWVKGGDWLAGLLAPLL